MRSPKGIEVAVPLPNLPIPDNDVIRDAVAVPLPNLPIPDNNVIRDAKRLLDPRRKVALERYRGKRRRRHSRELARETASPSVCGLWSDGRRVMPHCKRGPMPACSHILCTGCNEELSVYDFTKHHRSKKSASKCAACLMFCHGVQTGQPTNTLTVLNILALFDCREGNSLVLWASRLTESCRPGEQASGATL